MHISVDFLNRFRPGGPWLLVACDPTKKSQPKGLTFEAGQEKKMVAWIESMNKLWNIYFSVNPTIKPINKKALRTDIKSMDYLHVDIDPRSGEDLAEEQDRILNLFRNHKPRPTCVIFSGGGYQGFWKLEEPVEIWGEQSAFEDAKRYNMQLEILLGGDNCHNVDRIMRLPGTTNWPDAKKQAKGRIPAQASLIYFDESVVYPISKFTAAQPLQTVGSPAARTELGGAVSMPQISGNIQRLESVDDLPDDVKPWVKVLIVQGTDPDDPSRFPSRSEALFCVCCELVRAGCNEETIYSVITDPDFKIAESVVELGSRAEAYALKQIKSAMEQAEAPELRELNARHAVISSLGSKCLVISREWDHAFNRTKIVYQTFESFRNRYMNRQIKIGMKNDVPQFAPLGKWWLEHPRREQFDTMVFVPGRETPNAFNLWQGFSCEAKPGDCSLFLDHVKLNICSNVSEYYEYLLDWLAYSVQFPDQPAGVAVVLRGLQGTGKGVFSKTVGHLFGQHFLQVTNAKHLTGSFNNHLRDCVLLFADEAFYAGDKKNEAQLKALITEEQMIVEAKGIDAEFSRNYLHIIMASNSEWVIPVGMDDRRFFVLDVSDQHKEDREYFQGIRKQMEQDGGYEALLHLLMTRDLSGFNFSSAPKTEALHEQKQLGLGPEEAWWLDKLQEGRLLVRDEEWAEVVPKEELFMDYVEFVKRPGSNLYQSRCTKTRMTQFLRHFLPVGFPRQQAMSLTPDKDSKISGMRFNTKPICYIFPSLETCRDSWDAKIGCKTAWQDVEPAEDTPPF